MTLRLASRLSMAAAAMLVTAAFVGQGAAAAAGQQHGPKARPVPAVTAPPASRTARAATAHVLFGANPGVRNQPQPGTGGPRGAGPTGPPGTPPGLPVPAGPGSWLPSTPPHWPLVVGAQRSGPTEVTSGITHTETSFQTVVGPQRANVLDVNLTNPNVRVGVVEAGNKLIDPADETVSSMADRTGAVAGVNGAYFDIHATGAPLGMLVQAGVLQASPLQSWPVDLVILSDGQAEIGTETFSGSVTDQTSTPSTEPLSDVNQLGVETNPGMTLVTSAMGATSVAPSVVVQATEEPGATPASSTLDVTSVSDDVTALAALAPGVEDLVAPRSSSEGAWLSTVTPGSHLTVNEALLPYPLRGQAGSSGPTVESATTGSTIDLMAGGKILPDALTDRSDIRALTAVGITKGGHHLIVAAFDGIQPSIGLGLNDAEMAGYLKAHGAWSAMAFDSGGSTEMDVRAPGASQVSVVNSPSDGHERPVAQCLCFYSTEPSAGPAVTASVNAGAPLTMLAGTSVTVGAYALDALGNPASQPATLAVMPPGLASVSGDTITAPPASGSPHERTPPVAPGRTGAPRAAPMGGGTGTSGRLSVRAGTAQSSVPLRVVSSLASLSLSPSQPDVAPGASQAFTVAATAPGGGAVTIPPDAVTWSVNPTDLGTITSAGVFTAAGSGEGLATVTAEAGGATATASVAVGQIAKVVDPMTDVSNWTAFGTEGASGTLSVSSQAPPGAPGSMDVSYDIPSGQGVKQVVFYPSTVNDQITAYDGQDPTAVGIWVKGGSPAPVGSSSLSNGALTLAEGYAEVNGQSVVLYPTTVDFNGWTLVEGNLSVGTAYPLSVNFLDLLVINPASTLKGDVYLSDLEGLYSPRPAPPYNYVAEPPNPSWLQFTENPSDFAPGGVTLAAFDDAHLTCADPKSTGSVVLADIGTQLRALPANERPQMVQANGDMANNGTLCDLNMVKSALDGFGIPYHESDGDGETGSDAYPENGNFASVFGDTHYAYSLGAARVVVLDSGYMSDVEDSDPYQVPSDQTHQYAWLVSQLDQTQAKTVIVVVHTPAYSPHPRGDSQFANRYEAKMFELLAQKYQDSHPRSHLMLLFGQARGYAEQVLNPEGQQVPGGIPNFTVADAGVPAYAPPDQGGFYNYALFHVLPNGTVQFAVQPVLASITMSVPRSALAVGEKETLGATGTSPTGNNLPPVEVPIQNPASHYWTSSAPKVASVDTVTGVVTAHRPGTVTITVTSDGISASADLTVTG
jgi:hypothetical protein